MSVCTEINLFLLHIVYCFMFDYEKSRPTLRHFTKGEMAHSPESSAFIWCVPFWWLCFQFCTSVCCKCLVVCSKCLVVCTQWMYVCVFWKYGCVYQMKTRVPFCEQLRDLMAKSHLAKGVSGLALCVRGFQFSVFSFEKAVIVLKNVC